MKKKYFTEEERKIAKRKSDKKSYNKNAEKYKKRKKEYDKEQYQKNKKKKLEYQKEYYQKNKKKVIKIVSKWCQTHKEERKIYKREYARNKLKTDIEFKLKNYLRNRLYKAVKNNQKSGSAVGDLGCPIPELKLYLEARFQPGMTWDNYGKWHIDHIIPLASSNLQNGEEFLKACHYTNLQPLWAEENLKKGKN